MHILGLILTSFVYASKIGSVKEFVLQEFCETCSMFPLQDTSKPISPMDIHNLFLEEKLKSLATSAAIPMAQSTAVVKALVLGQPV